MGPGGYPTGQVSDEAPQAIPPLRTLLPGFVDCFAPVDRNFSVVDLVRVVAREKFFVGDFANSLFDRQTNGSVCDDAAVTSGVIDFLFQIFVDARKQIGIVLSVWRTIEKLALLSIKRMFARVESLNAGIGDVPEFAIRPLRDARIADDIHCVRQLVADDLRCGLSPQKRAAINRL